MRKDQNMWCTEVGDIVKIYWTHPRTEGKNKEGFYYVGKVVKQKIGWALVELMEEEPLRYDRYLEKDEVQFTDGFKFARQKSKYMKSRKILSSD